jgi:hypothetical protein
MMLPFDRFVAVDWSGAKGPGYGGIAVAECGQGDGAPILVQPPARQWRRTDFVDWLVNCAHDGKRRLIGIDCAFALPAPVSEAMLGQSHCAWALWAHIDGLCGDAADFYGGGFAEQADHAPLFWRAGPRPAGFAEHHRATELACREAGLGAPESPLKLIGARQVGKGGLAGMRVLSALKRRLGEDFAVWPFEAADSARIVCVELYPRLFLRMAGYGNRKVRILSDLDRCLAALGAAHYETRDKIVTDHETDAVIAAAGLRQIAGMQPVWNPIGLDALARRSEGWIFGVP